MTKLRLIKPWRLRTVRQHLNIIVDERLATAYIQRCQGPVAAAEDMMTMCRFEPMDIRSVRHVDGRSQHRVIAPVATCLQLRFANKCIR
jgi:hypothetical protein